MGEDEILAACLAHKARVLTIRFDVAAYLAPYLLEGGCRSGEVDAAQSRIRDDNASHVDSGRRYEVDNSIRQTGFF